MQLRNAQLPEFAGDYVALANSTPLPPAKKSQKTAKKSQKPLDKGDKVCYTYPVRQRQQGDNRVASP